MIQKIALTSLIALFVAMPAFAESFPVDEYMLENKTYDNAATLATDVLYDGDIATPVKAATYPGKTFVGWRFVKPDSGEEEGGSGY